MMKYMIHPDDNLVAGNFEHYARCGKEMADFASYALKFINNKSLHILELPCGYGRVTRHLIDKFSPENIFCCDLKPSAVDFCVATFGVNYFYVEEPIYAYKNIPDNFFDICIIASLVTLLDESCALKILKNLICKLKKGVCIISTGGERAFDMLNENIWNEHFISESEKKKIYDLYINDKYAFAELKNTRRGDINAAEYIHNTDGVSLIPLKWMYDVLTKFGYKILEHIPGGWDNHQDVFFIQSIN